MDKNRIGIITFQSAHNYGAILQCYALQEILKEKNFDVKVVNYEPEIMKDVYHYFRWKRMNPRHPKWALINIIRLQRRKKRYDSFYDFIQSNIDLSDSARLEYLSDDFDTIIIGSDQVWNINNSAGKYDNYYWGQFKINNTPHLISYAASMGGSWRTSDWKIISSLLRNFDAISVREDYLKNLIIQKCDLQAEWVLDPTLLQTRQFWISKVSDVSIKEPYLFYYQARPNQIAFEYAKRTAEEMKLKFICLSAEIMLYNSPEVISAGPLEFLELIKNAKYVITTSFHGTVFCYQFKKNFSTLKLGDGDDGRSSSFLSILGMQDRLISIDKEPVLEEGDWKKADINLSERRNFSLKWLIDNIFTYLC